LRVEVVFALPDAVDLSTVELPEGASVGDAIRASGLAARRPDIDSGTHGVGIFGVRKTLHDPVADGDRIEIYRPLPVDPKESRRQRAKSRY